jgi:salicylate hydroxylase
MSEILIAGAGIGGLCAAIALGGRSSNRNHSITIAEKSSKISEVGAGIQLGPNATRILIRWGLEAELKELAYEPDQLHVKSALSGVELASMRLGANFKEQYGAPYLTLHRADLHSLLYSHVIKHEIAEITLGHELEYFEETKEGVNVNFCENSEPTQKLSNGQNKQIGYDALIGADGVWSRVRYILNHALTKTAPIQKASPQLLANVEFSGDLAYRSLISQKSLPSQLRLDSVRVWLGPHMHLVQYPVRGGEWLNSVLFVDSRKIQNHSHYSLSKSNLLSWDVPLDQNQLRFFFQDILQKCCSELRDSILALGSWRAWPIMTSEPLVTHLQMAQGSVALLGDAAHPMLPYLAQGAGMAIEDANALGIQYKINPNLGANINLNQYSKSRWQRNAMVQKRALLNQKVFHADRALAVARNISLKLLGEKLLKMPWLYGHIKM